MMIAAIFLCFVALGITLGALLFGYGSNILVLALLPAAGLLLGLVSLVYTDPDFEDTEQG